MLPLSLEAKIENMNQIAITTTQNVNINFNLASVGDRLLAYIVDFLIRAAYVSVVLYLLFGVFDIAEVFNLMIIGYKKLYLEFFFYLIFYIL